VLEKLAPRLPRSIQKWAIAEGKPGIRQNKSDGSVVEIPMEKLVVFVNEMEVTIGGALQFCAHRTNMVHQKYNLQNRRYRI